MSAIGPGDWLQRTKPTNDGAPSLPVGGVYCVEALTEGLGNCWDCLASQAELTRGLVLVNVVSVRPWCACGFKPLGGGQAMTAPPARVCEPA